MEGPHSNPLRGFADMMGEMTRMRHLGMYGYEPGREVHQGSQDDAWLPAADVFTRGEDLVIRMDLAGVARERIHVTLAHGVLTVSGEREEDVDEGSVYYVHERYRGAFRRSMTLPAGVDEGHISADFQNGMLEITVQGAAAAEPQRIEVREKEG
jgi:HSP20 family protein